MNAVEVRGIGMVFGADGKQRVDALAAVDLTVGTGEFVSLIGPSGCGKSRCCESSAICSSQRRAMSW